MYRKVYHSSKDTPAQGLVFNPHTPPQVLCKTPFRARVILVEL